MREEIRYCMRKSGVVEKYVGLVHDMYQSSMKVVRCAVVVTNGFRADVGLCQVLTPNTFVFVMVMDRLTDEVRQEFPWTLMFADEFVVRERASGRKPVEVEVCAGKKRNESQLQQDKVHVCE